MNARTLQATPAMVDAVRARVQATAKPYERLRGKPGHGGEAPDLVQPERAARWDKDQSPDFNNRASTVTWLRSRKTIDMLQLEAAERLQRDWEMAEILPSASSVLVGAGGSANLPNDAKADAMRRHGQAMDHLSGQSPRARSLVELIVLTNHTVDKAGAIMRMNPQVAVGVLVVGLDMLVTHYGLRHGPRVGGFALDKP